MELKDKQASLRRRKRINNGLPEFENGSELYRQLNIPQKNDNWKDSLPGIAKFAVDVYDAFQPSYKKNDLINNYGLTGSSSRYGIGYQTKTLDTEAANKNANANFLGKVLGTAASGWNAFSSLGTGYGNQQLPKSKDGKLPNFSLGASTGFGIGGAVGGAILGTLGAGFARSKELKAQQEAQDYFNRLTTYNSNVAGTLGIQQKYADENIDPMYLKLRFACGKKPKFDDGKRVRSGFGLVDLPLTGWGNGGEMINQYAPDGTLLSSHVLPKTGNGTDTYPIYQDDYTEIIPTKIVDKMKKYKCGKLPKYDPGKAAASNWGNVTSALSGLGAGLAQYMMANLPVGKYNFTTTNPYLVQGMRTLNSLRVPDYPMERKMSKMLAKNKYAVDNSGAAGGLKDMYNREAVNSLYNTYADMMMQNIMQNNALKSDAAKTGITAYGQQQQLNSHEAITARQMADQASANANLGKQQAIYTADNAIKNYIKDYNKLNQWKLMYRLWSDDLDIRRDGLKSKGV